jgi:16S rRNA (uracil1498-N3)-methyltransferase
MRIPRFHVPASLTAGALLRLPAAAGNHAVRVLRLKPGAAMTLFDGAGGEYAAVLTAVDRSGVTVTVTDFMLREVESPLEVVLAQALARGERMDYSLQKAVELGVAGILPVWTEHSLAVLRGERLDRRLDHWRGVVAGACEQCGRNRVPPVWEPVNLVDWLASRRAPALELLLDPLAERGLQALARPTGAVTLLIGPEGGLSPVEVARATAAGFTGIRLGPRILRTETAGVAALAALQVVWGDLG